MHLIFPTNKTVIINNNVGCLIFKNNFVKPISKWVLQVFVYNWSTHINFMTILLTCYDTAHL